jgi:hypothetical protein
MGAVRDRSQCGFEDLLKYVQRRGETSLSTLGGDCGREYRGNRIAIDSGDRRPSG